MRYLALTALVLATGCTTVGPETADPTTTTTASNAEVFRRRAREAGVADWLLRDDDRTIDAFGENVCDIASVADDIDDLDLLVATVQSIDGVNASDADTMIGLSFGLYCPEVWEALQ